MTWFMVLLFGVGTILFTFSLWICSRFVEVDNSSFIRALISSVIIVSVTLVSKTLFYNSPFIMTFFSLGSFFLVTGLIYRASLREMLSLWGYNSLVFGVLTGFAMLLFILLRPLWAKG